MSTRSGLKLPDPNSKLREHSPAPPKEAAQQSSADWQIHCRMAGLLTDNATPHEDWEDGEDPWVPRLDDWRETAVLSGPDVWGV